MAMAARRKADRRQKAQDTERDERRGRQAEEIGHQHEANVNQLEHEPMPASEHDDRRQEAAIRRRDTES
jgi:hypothetical protein